MRYSDFRNNLEIHPLNGDLLRYTDEDSVGNEIKNLVFTNRYERFWDPKKGCSVLDTLFENMGPQAEYEIQTRVRETLNTYVRRARIIEVKVASNRDQNSYNLTIVFQPINSFEQSTLNLILKRVR